MPGYEGMHTHSHEDMLRQVEVKSKAANKRELHAVNVGTPGFCHISMIENSTLAAPWGWRAALLAAAVCTCMSQWQ